MKINPDMKITPVMLKSITSSLVKLFSVSQQHFHKINFCEDFVICILLKLSNQSLLWV